MAGENINHTVTINYPGCFFDGIIMHELLHTLGNRFQYSSGFLYFLYSKVSFMNNPDLIVIISLKLISKILNQVRKKENKYLIHLSY